VVRMVLFAAHAGVFTDLFPLNECMLNDFLNGSVLCIACQVI
jgi:hypothetical protein